MSTNVLVPLDGSALCESALGVATEIAGCTGGAVTLLVVTYAQSAEPLRDFAASEDVSTGEAADIYLAQVASRLADEGVQTRQATAAGSNVAEEIIGYAEANAISMIAMTTHGQSGVGRWLLGNVTDKVVRSSPVPVVVVPVRS